MTRESGLPPTESMSGSMSLDGDVDALRSFYRDWAEGYDADVTSHAYALPSMMVTMLEQTAELDDVTDDLRRPDLAILDVGCGTGLVGVELAGAGYRTIEGLDLSPDMVDIARSRGIYRRLEGDVDVNEPPTEHLVGVADVALVAGVFTVGHVPPTSLANVAAMVRPGGVLIASTRRAYLEETDYELVSQRLVDDGTVELLLCVEDGPYTMDSTAHYWSYRVR